MLKNTEDNTQLQFLHAELPEQFQLFCVFLDCRIAELTSKPVQAGLNVESTFDVSAFSEQVSKLIAEIVHVGQIVTQRQPELSDATVRDFQFLLAAWADEAMIKMLGHDQMRMDQHGNIERGMFGTVNAGDEFFHNITRMLERRNVDDISLAGAYWLALIQGFEGRYIGGTNSTELLRYARALQAIALKKIALINSQKPKNIELIQVPSSLIIRISQSIRPKILITFILVALMLGMVSLEMHWSRITAQLTQTILDMSNYHQVSADQQNMTFEMYLSSSRAPMTQNKKSKDDLLQDRTYQEQIK